MASFLYCLPYYNNFTCLATCLANLFANSAWDELLRNIFSGAFSKIHCSNLLGKLHCSCIFRTGYSIFLVNLHACLANFLQLPNGMCLSGIYLVVLSQKFTAITCLASCIVAASLMHVTQFVS